MTLAKDFRKKENMMKKMMKMFFVGSITAISLCMSMGIAVADDVKNLVIESLTITPPEAPNPDYRWIATIKNNGATSFITSALVVQGYQGSENSSWDTAGGQSVHENLLAPHGTGKSYGYFQRKANKDRVKVALFYQGTILDEKVVLLPAEAPVQLDVVDCTLDGTRYTATIKNLSRDGLTDFTVQGFTSTDPVLTPWVPGGGALVQSLDGNATYQHVGPKPKENEVIKIVISRGGITIGEKIIDKRTAPTKGTGVTPAKVSDRQKGSSVLPVGKKPEMIIPEK